MLLPLSRERHVPTFGGVREVDRSLGSLSRHPSFRRAVCVDAHVRICAGGDQRWSSLPRSCGSRSIVNCQYVRLREPIEN